MSHGHKPHWKPFVVTQIDPVSSTGSDDLPISRRKPWRPFTLRTTFLAALVLTTAGLIAIVQWLWFVSRRDQGILFAQDINDLPLRRSFYYLYLPTIVSVVYSFLWTWVDLDVKRLEPYFQLSNPAGATGHDSVLLSYPLEFLAAIPWLAFKHKHWTVLIASLASILILGGLTPSQAGIFAVRTVHISSATGSLRSTRYVPLDKQGNLSSIYAQSVYNIAWLNETLPPFMTKDYVLDPFGPASKEPSYATNASYSAVTTLRSVDITCENVTMWPKPGGAYYNSSSGCSFYGPAYRTLGGDDISKPYDTMYIGYQNQDGFADYYLSSYCDEEFFHHFFIRWSKADPALITNSSVNVLAPGQANETSLFCVPTYYQQEVNGTISLPSQEVLHVEPIAEKKPLPNDLFNSSTFEWAMSSGQAQFPTRSNYPVSGFPDQKSQLINTSLNLAYIPKMAPFAIATYQRPMEDYLDPETLRLSYQSAYRLLFARLISDVLVRDLDNVSTTMGRYSYATQAVVVVPVFAWIATTLLALILLLAVYLCIQCPRRPNNLRDEPGTIAALVDMVAGEGNTSARFSQLNECNTDELGKALGNTTFSLSAQDKTSRLRLQNDSPSPELHSAQSSKEREGSEHPGVRPGEMKTIVGIVFLLIQVLAVISFAVLYAKAQSDNGLPLPSNVSFTRQLVEKYIPIALATCIEPFWLVLNRLLCLLQPFEELRKGNRPASKSIDLNYSSAPPQFILGRALRTGHLVLAAVCLMTLLANALAVAMGGLMYEDTVLVARQRSVASAKQPRFQTLNGTAPPFNSQQVANSQGGTTFEPFYRQMSNKTAGTPLPPWADETFAYVPLDLEDIEINDTMIAETTAFGADANCQQLEKTGDNYYTMSFQVDALRTFIHVILEKDDGTHVNCSNASPWTRSYSYNDRTMNALREPQPGHLAVELNGLLSYGNNSSDDLFCRQHTLHGWLRADWKILKGKNAGTSDDMLPKMNLISLNATMLLCRPTITIETARIEVDSKGLVHELLSSNQTKTPKEQYFTSSEQDLVAQANQFFIESDSAWHHDAYPSDFINYLIVEDTNDTSLIDSSQPVPDPDMAARYITDLYRKLFAVLISTYSSQLLEDTTDNKTIPAMISSPETRIFLSTPAFIVAEAILACYILTTIVFYARRPWRVLPRLPSSIASIVAYFAASGGLGELSERKRRNPLLEPQAVLSSWRWGFGWYVGRDGEMHLGIEKAELVTAIKQGKLRSRGTKKR